jgi:hypothetical protein
MLKSATARSDVATRQLWQPLASDLRTLPLLRRITRQSTQTRGRFTKSEMTALVVLLLALFGIAQAIPQCRDEDGNPVDW